MYLPIDSRPSSARAWVASASAVKAAGGEAYNVIIDIADPVAEDATDTPIIQEVDRYLRAHNTYSVATVAKTIFPESTLRGYGPADFYAAYRERVFPRMKRITRDWGRYFDRLTNWKKVRNGRTTTINPLQGPSHVHAGTDWRRSDISERLRRRRSIGAVDLRSDLLRRFRASRPPHAGHR